MNLIQIDFPTSQYFREEYTKKQIYLHHTAGNGSGITTFKSWENNQERIATCVAISRDGQIIQGFNSKYWAYHLGLKESIFERFGLPYQSLDKISIGIEICNWGQLNKVDNKFINYYNKEVPANEVIELEKEFKGYKYFQNYTDEQISSVKDLLLLWKSKYGIPLEYHESIWDISISALSGNAGVYTHNSVRTDKIDVYPHPKLIEMLKSL